jgi:3-oxoacyl-[acyl-carrier-protein] synthase III
MSRCTHIIGWGKALPGTPVTNEALIARYGVHSDDAWIRQRTGITQRYIAAPAETTATLAAQAGEAALHKAGLTAEAVDIIIVATTTPDRTFPSTGTLVQAQIGARRAFAFDVQAVCSGFVYALATADALLKTGAYQTALVIGAETMTRLLDWNDRTTCVLFGDGAGAVVLRADDDNGENNGLLAQHLASDGRYAALLQTSGGTSFNREVGLLAMDGKEVFRHAVQKMSDSVRQTVAQAGVSLDQVDWCIPHQANRRILEAVGERLGLPSEKVVLTVDQHANTSAASIPLAFCTAQEDGRLQPGNLIAFAAMGAGFTWGSLLWRL